MLLLLPAQLMGRSDEATLLLRTGCPPANVDALLQFYGMYRTCMRASARDTRTAARRSETLALLLGLGPTETVVGRMA
jgi:hypothetical protein